MRGMTGFLPAAAVQWVEARRSDPVPLAAGWYALSPDVTAGDADQWRVDGIRADGGPAQAIALSSQHPGRDSVVLLQAPATTLEVRLAGPARCPPRLVVQRIGRARAAFRLLASIGELDPRGWRAMWRAGLHFLRTIPVLGTSAGGETLLARYHMALGDWTGMARLRREWRVRRRIGWTRPERLQLVPAPHVVADATTDRGVAWSAVLGPPQFEVSRADGTAPIVRAGWYRLQGSLAPVVGTLVAPRLQLTYAGTRPQPLPVTLWLDEPDAGGRIDMPLRFEHDVTALRFDASSRPAQLRMDGFRLRRMGRLEWTLRLLAGLRRDDGMRDWCGALATLADMARLAVRGRRGDAGELLASRYLGGRQRNARSYDAWVRRYDTLSAAELQSMADEGRELAASGPLFSVLLPVYQVPERWLRRCLDSVLAQAYPRWELCVADDASPAPHVRQVLREYERRDPRIRVAFRTRNGHICEASNTALEMARGDYVAFLDHDDELRPHALLEMAKALSTRPDVGLAYSDEDKIDEAGRRFQPYFKPDWNPDLLLSQNYVCHFTVVSAALAREVGGFRKGFEGSQDHDLFLRCTQRLGKTQVHHVPKILYHWRAIAGSTALAREAKDYAAAAGARAVRDHLRGIDARARVEALPHGHFRVRWTLPERPPKVSVLVPTRDRAGLLRTCVDSVMGKTAYSNFELVVVDNQSSEPAALAYLEELRARPGVRVLAYDAPFNYSAINNWAARQCDGDLLCLLNNDVEVIDGGWLEEMAGWAWRPDIGAVGAMLLYPGDTIQHAGVILGLGGVANHAYCHQPIGTPGHGARAMVAQNLSAVTGACLVVRRDVFEQVGGLDERLAVAFNDVDFCLRVREAGYRNAWTPFARLYHHESATRGADDSSRKITRFHQEVRLMQERWGPILCHDPAYNPNLSLEIDDTAAELAFPPRGRH